MHDFPANIPVCVHPFAPSTDSHGGVKDAWAAGETFYVIGISPKGDDASIGDSRIQREAEFQVFCQFPIGSHRARWVLPDGKQYEQVGDPADFSMGPWWCAGSISYLKRTKG